MPSSSARRMAAAAEAMMEIVKLDVDDPHAEPTKVGPMSQAAVDKMMREAVQGEKNGPASGERPRELESDRPLPSLADPSDDPDFQPTKLNHLAAQIAEDEIGSVTTGAGSTPPPGDRVSVAELLVASPPEAAHIAPAGDVGGAAKAPSLLPFPGFPVFTPPSERELAERRRVVIEIGAALAVLAVIGLLTAYFLFP